MMHPVLTLQPTSFVRVVEHVAAMLHLTRGWLALNCARLLVPVGSAPFPKNCFPDIEDFRSLLSGTFWLRTKSNRGHPQNTAMGPPYVISHGGETGSDFEQLSFSKVVTAFKQAIIPTPMQPALQDQTDITPTRIFYPSQEAV